MIRNAFTDQDAVLPLFFPGVLVRLLQSKGLSMDRLLASTNIQSNSFTDDNFKISFVQLKQLLKNAIEHTQDPHLGWRFGEHINVTSLGMLGYAAMSSSTLEKALLTINQYFKIRDPIYQLSLLHETEIGGEAAIQIDESLDFNELRYFLLSSAISGAASLITYFANQSDIVKRAELACPKPEDWNTQEQTLNFPVLFDAPYTRLSFNSSHLDNPLPTADPQTEKSTKEICDQLLSLIENQGGIVSEVREYILQRPGEYPNLEEAAAHFCVSSRTFRRELQKSGTSYQNILDQVREKIALEYLVKTTKPIQEIAYELGFKDLSNFGRAFKKWTGKAPSLFRER